MTATLKTSETGGATFLDVRGDVASFGYGVTAPDIACTDQIVDGSIAIAFNLMRQLCGPASRPRRARLIREPPQDKAPFTRFFQAPIEFAAPAGRIVFDAATLDAPVRDSNPDYAAVLAPLLEEAAANARGDLFRGQIDHSHTDRRRRAQPRQRLPTLGLNPRTFAHRLEANGVTYSGLAEEAKFEAAQSLL